MRETLTIRDLVKKTSEDLRRYNPYEHLDIVTPGVLKYNPAIWQETDGVWHTLLGAMPEECIWTLGTTPEESMREFDKELNRVLQPDGAIKFLSGEERQELHREVGFKIDRILQRILDEGSGRNFSWN